MRMRKLIDAALMALIMSTVDSCLLSAASTLSEDFYHACLDKNASKERLVNVSRFSVLFIAIVGIFLAVNSGGRSIMTVMLFASGGRLQRHSGVSGISNNGDAVLRAHLLHQNRQRFL